MITVSMLREGDLFVGFHAQGHAEYADPGADIVCSAVSALTQTAALGLTEKLGLEAGVSILDSGEMHCILGRDCTREQCERADIILGTLYIGLRAMEESYGEYLKTEQREV